MHLAPHIEQLVAKAFPILERQVGLAAIIERSIRRIMREGYRDFIDLCTALGLKISP